MNNINEDQTRTKTIVLDVDGVLLKFTEAFDQAASICLKRKVVATKCYLGTTSYDLAERANCSIEEVENILQFMLDTEMYAHFQPLEGAKEAIKALRKAGFKMVICTALPEVAKEMRLRNLKDALDFEPDEAYFVGMGCSKEEALNKIKPDVYVDDRVKYLLQAKDVPYLVWCDQFERQDESSLDATITNHVKSLHQWTKDFMPKVAKELDAHYKNNQPLQLPMKLETPRMKHR